LENTNNSIKNFEVTRPPFLGGGKWNLKNTTPITVIFGKNGSGKSLLLRNIRSVDVIKRHYCSPERGGNISFAAQNITEELEGQSRANHSKLNVNPTYRDQVIARIAAFLQKKGLLPNPDPESLDKIKQSLLDLLPDFEFEIADGTPPYSLKRSATGEQIQNIDVLSSGESQILTLGLDLLLICNIWKLEEKEGILLVDEPDPHVHPDLQQRFAKFLVQLHDEYGCRIFVATHSTTMLSSIGHYGGTNTSVVYLDNSKEDQFAIKFNKILQKLSTCLGGHALMGPLFEFPLLLVEGDDDYGIWSEVPRHQGVQISAIPCNGEEIYDYQRILEKLFSSILDSSSSDNGFALLDGDKNKPTTSQNYVKFIKLNCHESENLYLTDELLSALNLDWDSACQKVEEESVNFLSKAEFLKTIRTWDRKTIDCKNYIKELAKILDDKNLVWTHRLGKELGKNRPEGQLADFLGEEVVNAIWGT